MATERRKARTWELPEALQRVASPVHTRDAWFGFSLPEPYVVNMDQTFVVPLVSSVYKGRS